MEIVINTCPINVFITNSLNYLVFKLIHQLDINMLFDLFSNAENVKQTFVNIKLYSVWQELTFALITKHFIH
jgi:hypothetical protein